MTSLLIVDDEKLAVAGIISVLNRDKLHISQIHSAYNINQAKEIFLKQPVDVMLCDIEMPSGSGLELLDWVNNNYPGTVSVILTCHADFEYAKKAVQLNSLDYILKPVPPHELEAIVKKAIEKLHEDQAQAQLSIYGHYWFQNQPLLIERFWLDVLNQNIEPDSDAISRAAIERNIPLHDAVVPILIVFQRWHSEVNHAGEQAMKAAIRNAAEFFVNSIQENSVLLSLGTDEFLAIVPATSDAKPAIRQLLKSCERFIGDCHRYYKCDLCIYLGEDVVPRNLAEMVKNLKGLEENNVAYYNRVIHFNSFKPANQQLVPPNMQLWSAMLLGNAVEEVIQEAIHYLNGLVELSAMNVENLTHFHHDFLQMIYYLLTEKGVMARQLLSDEQSLALSKKANRSLADMIDWIRHIINKAMSFLGTIEEAQSVVERTKEYILRNINKELTRESIAGHVFLNPDYLARVFKKSTGVTINDFILNERVNIAQELLAKTDMPISAVAAHLDYMNFSKFSQMFKNRTGFNPIKYRETSKRLQAKKVK
ncbi:response regulator [Paenibacillus durus]|uniref:AraC family transcriptional regulator n=1 Tax=Paenibacillus durus TaxID=44251 RepID=A0A089HP37_PAEDU|nr:response regulator [Paenibacillus durus]AIQ12475.1 hypothetical protein PDUR_11610 [Paenibacillus durus]